MNEFTMYSPSTKCTIDGEWDESELYGDIDDEVDKYYKSNRVNEKYEYSAVYDKDMLKPQYMAEKIRTEYDLIEEYNKQYDKRKSEGKFGIHYFDDWVSETIRKLLKDNLVE